MNFPDETAWKALQDKTWWRADGGSWSGLQGLLLLTSLHGQCCWAWEVFAVLGAVSLFLEADAPSWELYLFSSTSPKEKFPLFSVHQNSKVVLKPSETVGPRDMFFILSLLSWLGSFSLSLPAVNNVQLTPSAWQSPPLLTYGLGCLSLLYPVRMFQLEFPFGRKFAISSWRPKSCSLKLHGKLLEYSQRTREYWHFLP